MKIKYLYCVFQYNFYCSQIVRIRNQSIKNSLAQAEKARNEMSELTANNEKIIAQAKVDRDVILKEARDMKNEIITKDLKKTTEEEDAESQVLT